MELTERERDMIADALVEKAENLPMDGPSATERDHIRAVNSHRAMELRDLAHKIKWELE